MSLGPRTLASETMRPRARVGLPSNYRNPSIRGPLLSTPVSESSNFHFFMYFNENVQYDSCNILFMLIFCTEKRSLALNNVETLLCSVEEAQSNGDILDAYKIGSKALQNMLNTSGLKYDNVDEVISDVRESIETHNEIQDTLANANIADSVLSDDDSLESELREILSDAEKNKAAGTTQKRDKEKSKATTANSTTNNNDSKVIRQIDITDAELLEMLEGLEVEDSSPTKTVHHSKDTIFSK